MAVDLKDGKRADGTSQPLKAKHAAKASFKSSLIDLYEKMAKCETLESFQSFMMEKSSMYIAKVVVDYIENNAEIPVPSSASCHEKLLLSVMLLSRFPNELIPEKNDEEKNLTLQAKTFDAHLEHMASMDLIEPVNLEETLWKWLEILNLFTEWCSKDRKKLLQKLRDDFLSWTKKIGAWQDDHQTHAEWEPHVLLYQNKLLKKLFQIYGEKEIDSLKGKLGCLNASFSKAEMKIDVNVEEKTCSCRWVLKSDVKDSDSVLETLQSDESKFFSNLTNIRLLHELILKEEGLQFEGVLNLGGKSTKEVDLKNKKMIQAICTFIKVDADGKTVSKILSDVFRMIQATLMELAGENMDYKHDLRNLDCTVNEHDWVSDTISLLNSIASFCRLFCAPIRDQACEELKLKIRAFSDLRDCSRITIELTSIFEHVFELLNQMRMDYCNFRLKFLAGKIKGKAVAEKYELDAFKSKFSTISETQKWLKNSAIIDPNPRHALALKFIELIYREIFPELKEKSLPETFYLDIDRIAKLRSDICAALRLETAKVYLTSVLDGKADIDQKARLLLDRLWKNGVSACNHDIIGDTDRTAAVLRKISDLHSQNPEKDKIFCILKQRMMSITKSTLLGEAKKSHLVEFEESVQPIIARLKALFDYNKQCYYPIYDTLLQQDSINK